MIRNAFAEINIRHLQYISYFLSQASKTIAFFKYWVVFYSTVPTVHLNSNASTCRCYGDLSQTSSDTICRWCTMFAVIFWKHHLFWCTFRKRWSFKNYSIIVFYSFTVYSVYHQNKWLYHQIFKKNLRLYKICRWLSEVEFMKFAYR